MTDKIATPATYIASGSAFAFGMSANEIAMLGSLAVAIATFIVNFWFKWDRRRRMPPGIKEKCPLYPMCKAED